MEQTFKEQLVQDSAADWGEIKMFFLRRGSGTFPQVLEEKLKTLHVRRVHQVAQSESDGNLSFTMIYS